MGLSEFTQEPGEIPKRKFDFEDWIKVEPFNDNDNLKAQMEKELEETDAFIQR